MSGGTSCLLLSRAAGGGLGGTNMSGGTSCLLLFEQLVAASEERP